MENHRIQGKKIQDLITDKGLTDFLLSRNDDFEKLINLHSRDVFLTRIIHKNSHTIVCRFKVLSEIEEDNLKVKELRKKGYYGKYTFNDIIGKSTSIQRACQTGKKLAASSLTILLEGESGTGKELMASAIHNSSSRKDEPYLAINLNAINESLLESELFGYEPGAFTGASREGKPGLFEQADGGTLFLDEIGDISPNIQKGLLRVLQDGEVMRIGGNRIRRTDVRIIAATNKNLATLARNGDFRNDLLYRIRQGYIQIPALRERKGDIPILIQHLISCEGYSDVRMDSDLIKKFNYYNWPGNIRELKNIILCMLAIKEKNILQYSDIPPGMFGQSLPQPSLSVREQILLESVESISHEGLLVTREKVFQDCRKKSYPYTLSQVRKSLEDLLFQGYLIRKKDRYGISLSEKGIRALNIL